MAEWSISSSQEAGDGGRSVPGTPAVLAEAAEELNAADAKWELNGLKC